MSKSVYAGRVDQVAPGAPILVKHGSLTIGVFAIEGGWSALLNVCPHRGGQLCEGPVCGTAKPTRRTEFVYDRANELVRCAWHGWEFEIATGRCLVDDRFQARRFPVRREGDDLYIEIGQAAGDGLADAPAEATA